MKKSSCGNLYRPWRQASNSLTISVYDAGPAGSSLSGCGPAEVQILHPGGLPIGRYLLWNIDLFVFWARWFLNGAGLGAAPHPSTMETPTAPTKMIILRVPMIAVYVLPLRDARSWHKETPCRYVIETKKRDYPDFIPTSRNASAITGASGKHLREMGFLEVETPVRIPGPAPEVPY